MSSTRPVAVVVLLLATSAFAQSDLRAQLRPITTEVKHAGVLHLGTGSWTRHLRVQELGAGPEIVYANTCASGYYMGLIQGLSVTDEGALPNAHLSPLPSTAIPGGYDRQPGCAGSYEISGFEIAYCTWQPTYTTTIRFYDQYQDAGTGCAAPGTPTKTFADIAGLPGSPSGTSQACWLVTVDLGATPAEVFSLSGTGGSQNKVFGWSFLQTELSPPTRESGPLIAGGIGSPSPATCTGTDATRWDAGTASIAWPANRMHAGGEVIALEQGTGLLNLDVFRTDGSQAYDGCHWFGGVMARGSFHLQLHSDVECAPCGDCAGVPYCFGDGSTATACPCGNFGVPGAGCNNSAGNGGALLAASGGASVANDTLSFAQSNELPSSLSIFLQGTASVPGGLVFGDGVRCVGGSLLRLYVKAASTGTVVAPVAGTDPSVSARSAALGDAIVPGTSRHYGVYYRDPSPSFCADPPGNTWNIGNGVTVAWQ